MTLRTLIPLAALTAAFGVTPAVASADTLLAPTPAGSQNLTSNGGWMAWAQPNQPAGSGFRLVVRAPDGTVTTPDIPVFEEVPDPSIGSTTVAAAQRRLIVTYTRQGDVFSYDLLSGAETKVRGASSGAIERAADVVYGTYAFVRVDGRRAGVYTWSPKKGARRVSADVPRELAFNGTRVAYALGRSVIIRRLSGEGRVARIRNAARPESVLLTRYRASWLVGDEAYKTNAFGPSGRPDAATQAIKGSRPIEGATSIAFGRGDRVSLALDAEGVKRLDPTPFGSTG